MSVNLQDNWNETNQRHLIAELARVRKAIEAYVMPVAGDKAGGPGLVPLHTTNYRGPANPRSTGSRFSLPISRKAIGEVDGAPALDRLCTAFSLSPFERDVLLLCACMELDGSFRSLCASAQADPQRPFPTFSLALAALPEPHWNASTPAAPLRYWKLLHVETGETLSLSPLRIEERVLHYLMGLSYLDENLRDIVQPLYADEPLASSHRSLRKQIAELWSRSDSQMAWPIIQLSGDEHAAKLAIAAAAGAEVGASPYVVQINDIPLAVSERQSLARLWGREAALNDCILIVDYEQIDELNKAGMVLSFVESIRGRVVLIGREPLALPSHTRAVIRLEVNKLNSAEQFALWEGGLGPVAHKLNGQLETLVARFNLGAPAIRAVCAEALITQQENEDPDQIGEVLWQACRRQARPRLDDLAQRIKPAATWDDLILPEIQRQTLRDIVIHVRRRIKVYETWGFASKGSRGLGISALFAGVSGTGKTMAVEVLAQELNLDVYRVDLSAVVSKYIGETEKNLRRVFDAAEGGGSILLFDEADALFGKRSEVRDSHDRYANIEVSYLLQRIESFHGLAILTTNMKGALDSAFLRRIRFIVQFPFPDATQRTEIWRHVFPKDTPTKGLDFSKLACLNIAGGNIRNIALNAAFLAAEAGDAVHMSHLLCASRSEYIKLERPLNNSEITGWV